MQDAIILYENGKAIGGEGHPTDADDITFDNTGTDLVSENVEDAIKEVDAKTSGLTRMTKLWENPSPTASFAAQEVTLSSDDYDFYICLFSEGTTTTSALKSAISIKGKGIVLDTADSGYTFYRAGSYVSDTKISFATGYREQTANTSVCIPIAIYGIKLI